MRHILSRANRSVRRRSCEPPEAASLCVRSTPGAPHAAPRPDGILSRSSSETGLRPRGWPGGEYTSEAGARHDLESIFMPEQELCAHSPQIFTPSLGFARARNPISEIGALVRRRPELL